VGAEMLQSLSDDHIVDGHLVVREELDLHDNVSLVAQDGIGEIDFVQIIAQWVVADTATDVVAEVKRRFAENNIDDGWEQLKPVYPAFGDRVGVSGLREDAPERFRVAKAAKFDLPSATWRSAERVQPLSKVRQHCESDTASELFARRCAYQDTGQRKGERGEQSRITFGENRRVDPI
jgi:hypothetical protein